MSGEIPFDLPSEEAVIGACLIAGEACDTAIGIVTPSDFYNPFHQRVFEAIRTLRLASEPVDVVSVADAFEMHERGEAFQRLHGLQNEVPAVSAVNRYASQVLAAAKWRSLIAIGADITQAGYERRDPVTIADSFSRILADHEVLRRHGGGALVGFYDDIATLDSGEDRDDAQPWIARGVMRRGQRLMVVAKAGVGKSTFLRQLAYCAENGVHPFTQQPSEKPRRSLVVELEAGRHDITDTNRTLLAALRRIRQTTSMFDLNRPALLHRPEGLDVRSPSGRAVLELALQRVKPELVVMGPVKYMYSVKPGENYEMAALGVHTVLNDLMAKYHFGLAMEAHFSRGDQGAPGGSERWVDWPDVGFALHPPEGVTNLQVDYLDMVVKPFRNPRDAGIYIPGSLTRAAGNTNLPWTSADHLDPRRPGCSVYAERWGGVRQVDYTAYTQTETEF